MAHLDVHEISLSLPDGRGLLDAVSFRVGPGERTALIGANGAGKTTLLGIITGESVPDSGGVSASGALAVMPQFAPEGTIAEVLLAGAPPRVRRAAARMAEAEAAMEASGSERHQMAFAEAVTAYGDAGGYEAEVLWDTATVAALGQSYEHAAGRGMDTLSGGEQKRLLLEVLLRGPADLLILDEPDNHLDVPAKRWLEEQLRASGKTILFISHDRELLAEVATSIVTLELGGLGSTAWVHPGDFGGYHAAREERFDRLDELRRRWAEDRAKLRALVTMYRQKSSFNSDMASRYRSAKTRLERFEAAGPPQERPREQQIDPRLRGARSAKRAVVATGLELSGLTEAFDLEVWHGDRLAVLGPNGTGKSHLLRLLAAGGTDPGPEHRPVAELPIEPVEHSGRVVLGSRVRPGWFSQTQVRADLEDRTLPEILHRGDEHRAGMGREQASRALARYELAGAAEQEFGSLSGGQRARLQILLLELAGATLLLLLDEPTDHLDLVSAEALQAALARFQGTVIAVTHDRWFARDFDRFAILGDDGVLIESAVPRWGRD